MSGRSAAMQLVYVYVLLFSEHYKLVLANGGDPLKLGR